MRRKFVYAIGIVLIGFVIAACSSSVTMESPSPSLLGIWFAQVKCGPETTGISDNTLIFTKTTWELHRRCELPNGEVLYQNMISGDYQRDGNTVVRTRDGVTATKEIVWLDDASFKTHPFHWADDDQPDATRTYQRARFESEELSTGT